MIKEKGAENILPLCSLWVAKKLWTSSTVILLEKWGINRFGGDYAYSFYGLSFLISFQHYNQVQATLLCESKANVFNLGLLWNFKLYFNSCPIRRVSLVWWQIQIQWDWEQIHDKFLMLVLPISVFPCWCPILELKEMYPIRHYSQPLWRGTAHYLKQENPCCPRLHLLSACSKGRCIDFSSPLPYLGLKKRWSVISIDTTTTRICIIQWARVH